MSNHSLLALHWCRYFVVVYCYSFLVFEASPLFGLIFMYNFVAPCNLVAWLQFKCLLEKLMDTEEWFEGP